VTTAADVAAYSRAVDDLTVLAFSDIEALLNSLDQSDPVALREALLDLLPAAIEPYIGGSADLAALWYEELRNQTERARMAAVVAGATVNEAQIAAMTRRAMAPLFGKSESTVFALLAGSVQRLISNAGRDTIRTNVMRDRIRVGYARIPQPGCCAFCSMLASRGAVYNSASSAGAVQGRGMALGSTAGKRGGQARGVKTRGDQDLGDRFHDFCRCRVAPIFVGDSLASDVAEEHQEVYRSNIEFRGDRAIDMRATLANIRAETGRK